MQQAAANNTQEAARAAPPRAAVPPALGGRTVRPVADLLNSLQQGAPPPAPDSSPAAANASVTANETVSSVQQKVADIMADSNGTAADPTAPTTLSKDGNTNAASSIAPVRTDGYGGVPGGPGQPLAGCRRRLQHTSQQRSVRCAAAAVAASNPPLLPPRSAGRLRPLQDTWMTTSRPVSPSCHPWRSSGGTLHSP
jgi:hypothetical protein